MRLTIWAPSQGMAGLVKQFEQPCGGEAWIGAPENLTVEYLDQWRGFAGGPQPKLQGRVGGVAVSLVDGEPTVRVTLLALKGG